MMKEEASSNYMERNVQHPDVLRLRLDTSEIISKIESYLRGYQIVYEKDENGKIVPRKVGKGKQKANDEGVQELLNWISSTFNSATAQGNFPADASGNSPAYDRYICEYHKGLTEQVIVNVYDWDISVNDINGIISSIMNMIIPFFTRLIDNKERESYSTSLRTEQRNVQNESKGIKGWFGS